MKRNREREREREKERAREKEEGGRGGLVLICAFGCRGVCWDTAGGRQQGRVGPLRDGCERGGAAAAQRAGPRRIAGPGRPKWPGSPARALCCTAAAGATPALGLADTANTSPGPLPPPPVPPVPPPAAGGDPRAPVVSDAAVCDSAPATGTAGGGGANGGSRRKLRMPPARRFGVPRRHYAQ